jgi:hypothetical protein
MPRSPCAREPAKEAAELDEWVGEFHASSSTVSVLISLVALLRGVSTTTKRLGDGGAYRETRRLATRPKSLVPSFDCFQS